MRRHLLPAAIGTFAAGLLLVLLIGIARSGSNHSIDNEVARGKHPMAPDSSLALPVLGGSRTARLDDFRGKVVVLNAFASWCDSCQAEVPVLRRAQTMLRSSGGKVLGVSYQDAASSTTSYMRRYDLHYEVLRDPSSDFAHSLGTFQVPETFIISPAGRILALDRGQITMSWLTQHLPGILRAYT